MPTWFCKVGERQLGPLSAQQVKTLVSSGKLRPEHLIRRGAEGSWVQAAKVKGLFPASGDEPTLSDKTPTPGTLAAPPRSSSGRTAVRPPPREPAAVAPPAAAGPPRLAAVASAAAEMPVIQVEVTDKPASVVRGLRAPQPINWTKWALVALGVVVLGAVGGGLGFWLGGGADTAEDASPAAAAKATAPGKPKEAVNLETLALDYRPELVKGDDGPASDGWYNAAKAAITVRQEGRTLSVRIKDAQVGVVPKYSQAGTVLVLHVALENKDRKEPAEYNSWGLKDGAARGVKLVDQKGQEYRIQARVVEGSTVSSIAPGQVFEDLLLFKPPKDDATELRLELPAAAVKAKEPLRFRIPMSMVNVSPDHGEVRDAPAAK